MMEKPINQISGLENPLKASAIAPPGFGLVTPVNATSAIAITPIAPIGNALPMIAAMVAIKSANKCQALGLTPAGTGMTNQINAPITKAMIRGTILTSDFIVCDAHYTFQLKNKDIIF